MNPKRVYGSYYLNKDYSSMGYIYIYISMVPITLIRIIVVWGTHVYI